MKSRSSFHTFVTYVAGAAMIATQVYWAPKGAIAAENNAPPTIRDVELNPEGTFVGKVVDKNGEAASALPVEITQGKVVLASTRTDASGQFAINSMRGGAYQVRVAKNQYPIRVWSHGAAPPNASLGLDVQTGMVARGQGCTTESCTGECGGTCEACCGSRHAGIMGLLMNPIVIGAAIAAAIAIPLALDDDDDAS